MKLIDGKPDDSPGYFYTPCHCVFKSVQSNKIRVVFDASSKSSMSVFLNDVLMVGLTIQQNLISIMLRFRTFKFVLAADIVKMYRQVKVHASQTRLQRILWRSDSSLNVQTYKLITVTYGTSSASFLTTRYLKYLAEKHANKYPRGSMCVQRDFYVDDLLTGADMFDEAIALRDETINLLQLGAFELSTWASNCPELLTNINNQTSTIVTINTDAISLILGIQWNQSQVTFHYSHSPSDYSNATFSASFFPRF